MSTDLDLATLDHWFGWMRNSESWRREREIVYGMWAEIERLREENSTLSDSLAAKADRIDRLGETVVRLRGLLADAPCTCPNSPPWDWPHDPHNEDCYLNRIREALGE